LSIALGILIAFGQLAADLDDALVIGELSLGGSLRHMTGVLLMIGLAKEQRLQRAFVPAMDTAEAALVEGMTAFPVKDLTCLVCHLTGEEPIASFAYNAEPSSDDNPEVGIDLQHIRG
jgi:magnesium chelatase family protein